MTTRINKLNVTTGLFAAAMLLSVTSAQGALTLSNGDFDADGGVGGGVAAITDWTRPQGNGVWFQGSPWGAVPPPTSSPNVGLLNSATSSGTGTQFESVNLSGSIDPGLIYTLGFDIAARDQGQFGGGANIISNLGDFDLDVEFVGSVDGVLASIDGATLIASVDTYTPGSLVWDSAGATAVQNVTVRLTASSTNATTGLQFVLDSLTLTSAEPPVPAPEPSTFVLAALGIFGLGMNRRRRNRG